MNDNEFDNVFYVVEANSFERSTLWGEWSKESIEANPDSRTLLNWPGNGGHGFMIQVGELAGCPVTVQFSFDTINGAKIVFYHATSQVVDHRMVRKWLDKNLLTTLDDRTNHTDAMNFHTCVHAIQDYACESVNG